MKYILAVALLFAFHVTHAQPVPDILDSLARSWSGGHGVPICRQEGVDRDGIPVQVCEWNREPKIASTDTVRVTRYHNEPALLTWYRTADDLLDAHRILDSLGTVFERRGMTRRTCGDEVVTPAGRVSGLMWESGSLAVVANLIVPERGKPRYVAMVTISPTAFPEIACPKNQE